MFQEIPASKKSSASRKPVFGIGINDADYITQPTINGKKEICPHYRVWCSMLMRCYSSRFHVKQPTYIDSEVCREWLLFSAFKAWMMTQEWAGMELDKDILVPGNKVYSPNTCCFISKAVNNLLTDRAAKRGKYPKGVSRDKHRNKYRAGISIKGKTVYLGFYPTSIEAELAYLTAKAAYIVAIAHNQPSPRVREGLLRHAELLT